MPPAAIRTVLRLGTTSPPDVTVLTAPLSGGAVYADVLIQSAAGATFPTKDVGRAKYEDLIVTLGDSASAPFLAWLATAWQASPPQRSGAVLTVDGQTIRSQTSFGPALISEASFPALGGANPPDWADPRKAQQMSALESVTLRAASRRPRRTA